MSPSSALARLVYRSTTIALAAGLVMVGAVVPLPHAHAATATLSITPLGWNIVGLDSNAPTGAASPARYAVGARVCNTSATTATGVSATWAWTSTNANISILGSASKAAADLAPGACRPMHWTVDVARLSSSFDTARGFRIAASASNATSVQTPANREIYVEKLISQARNNVTGSSGPTSVYVGGTYTWTFTYDTGTFNQVMAGAFLDPSIFEIGTVSQTYSTGGANNQFYFDACGWRNDTAAAGYRSCTNNNKVGGTITSTVTATVTGTGTSKISPLVLDFSGSSFHYNSDYSTSVYALTVTATAPPAPTAVADSASTAVATAVDVDVLANDTAGAGSIDTSSLSVTVAPANGTTSIVGGKVRYTPAAGFVGTSTFTYRVCNTFAVCSTAVATITVSGPPTAVNDSATAPTAVATTIDVLGNDSSPASLPLTISSVGTPSHGTATIVAGQVQYTSTAGYQGPDSFSYTISDGAGGTSTGSVSVTVSNTAPTAADDSAATTNGTAVTIPVRSNDSDPNGDALTISSVGAPSHGTTSIVSGSVVYTPTAGYKGTDSFTYTVSDGFGGTASATVTVSVANAAPVAAGDAASTPGGTAVDVPLLTNDTDPNSDPLTPSIVTAPTSGTVSIVGGVATYTPAPGFRGVVTFTYAVSDGTTTSAPATVTITVGNTAPTAADDSATSHGPVAIDALANDGDANSDLLTISGVGTAAHGTVAVVAGEVIYTPAAGWSGTDSFTYTISDGQGGTSTATVVVTITNAAPVAVDDDVTLVHGPGASTTVDVLGNDTDADNDTLVLVDVTDGTHGTAAVVGGKVVYTPAAGFVGDDVVTYTVSDGFGGTATATLTIHVTNTAPVAVDDSASTPTGTDAVIDVLANDTDADSDTLSVASVGTPAHGSVVVNPDGTLTYTPAPGYRGSDSFTYTVSDGTTTSTPATVSITVLNAAPVAQDDLSGTASGTPVDIDVLGNDSDPNSDLLAVTAVGTPSNGTASINPDGTITYTPAAGFAGSDTFTYTIVDSAGSSSTATITVVVGGAGPVAVDDSATTPHGVAVTIDVLGNDSDPNPSDVLGIDSVGAPGHGTAVVFAGQIIYTPDAGFVGDDTFTYVVTDFTGGVAVATVTVTVTNAAPVAAADSATIVHGAQATVDVLANDSDADSDTVVLVDVTDGAHGTADVVAGQVVYTPAAGFVGVDTVTYTISDGVGGTSTGVLTITVTNSAPTAVDDASTAISGVAVEIAVLGNDSDPESDPLTVTAVGSPGHGTAVVSAGGITYTAADGFEGVDTFTYTVSDGHGGSTTATVTVTVTAATPPPTPTLEVSASTLCLVDAPYLGYSVELLPGTLSGATDAAVGAVAVTWRDADGDIVATWTAQPASGTLLWPGAAVGDDGRGSDWPGWVMESGAWVRGADGFERTLVGSTIEFSLAGVSDSASATYPVRTADCAPAPRLITARDSTSTPAGQPVDVRVVGNDSGVSTGAKVTITSPPSHGTVVVNDDGTVTYTPDPGFVGNDEFGYTVTNADGQVSSTTVTVTVDAEGVIDDSVDAHPGTGADITGLLGLGLLLVLVGAALRRTARA